MSRGLYRHQRRALVLLQQCGPMTTVQIDRRLETQTHAQSWRVLQSLVDRDLVSREEIVRPDKRTRRGESTHVLWTIRAAGLIHALREGNET